MRPIPKVAVEFLKTHEACVLRVYDDGRPSRRLKPGDAPIGTLTAGFGHTGPDVHAGMSVTQAKADDWLRADLEHARDRLYGKIGAVVEDLTDYQFAALLSFVFNLGVPGTTIWQRLKARQFDQVPAQIMLFDKARLGPRDPKSGKRALVKVDGLVRRRAAEVQLWSTNEPGSIGSNPPSSVTRAVETPPTPADPKPAAKSATLITAAATAVAAAVPAVQQGIATVEPFADRSPLVGRMVETLSAIAAVLAILVLVLTWLKHRQGRS